MSKNMTGVRKNLTRILSLGLIAGAASCSTDVVNPGPISSEFLNDPAAQVALVNGAGRGLGDAMNWIVYTTAAVAREVHPSGSTGSFGITPEQQQGYLSNDEVGTHWANAHRARFLASNTIDKILSLPAEDQNEDQLALAYLYAGYSSRLLGEQMCNSVFDGGPSGSSDLHLDSAVYFFTQAEGLATGDLKTAAIAGRAAAYLQLGNFTAAVADAQEAITLGGTSFSYSMPYFDLGDANQANRLYFAGAARPYKAHSQIFTWIAEYNTTDTTVVGSEATADPRVSWRVSGETGDANSQCCGLISWFPQTKYTNEDAAIELSSYAEMKLILAENELRQNSDFAAAMVHVNDLRTAAGVPTVTATSLAEGWTFYKREHAIEMWLEGRRLPAMRRWNDAGDDESTLQPLERVGDGDTATGSHLATRDFCIPISEAEQDTNPNIGG